MGKLSNKVASLFIVCVICFFIGSMFISILSSLSTIKSSLDKRTNIYNELLNN